MAGDLRSGSVRRVSQPPDPFAPHALGDAATVVGQAALATFSTAAMEAADNLLRKAAKALASGDDERAGRMIARAVALPYDRREEMHPAACAATTMLFTTVGDELEERADDDTRWLDAAVQVLPAEAGWGRAELLATLRAVRDDYGLDRHKTRTIDAALAETPDRPELQAADLPAAELAVAVTAVLEVVVAYVEALDSRD